MQTLTIQKNSFLNHKLNNNSYFYFVCHYMENKFYYIVVSMLMKSI